MSVSLKKQEAGRLPSAPDEGSSEVLRYTEAAELLSLSVRTLERYVVERQIPFVELPMRGSRRRVRFLKSQLLAWLERRTVKPSRFAGGAGS